MSKLIDIKNWNHKQVRRSLHRTKGQLDIYKPIQKIVNSLHIEASSVIGKVFIVGHKYKPLWYNRMIVTNCEISLSEKNGIIIDFFGKYEDQNNPGFFGSKEHYLPEDRIIKKTP